MRSRPRRRQRTSGGNAYSQSTTFNGHPAFIVQYQDVTHKATGSSAPLVEPLSPREVQVLRLMVAGATNQEIAARLCIAPGTVKNHVTNILGKLGVDNRTQAALKERDLRLL